MRKTWRNQNMARARPATLVCCVLYKTNLCPNLTGEILHAKVRRSSHINFGLAKESGATKQMLALVNGDRDSPVAVATYDQWRPSRTASTFLVTPAKNTLTPPRPSPSPKSMKLYSRLIMYAALVPPTASSRHPWALVEQANSGSVLAANHLILTPHLAEFYAVM